MMDAVNFSDLCITICIIAFLIFLSISVKACTARETEVTLKCLSVTTDVRLCENLASGR